MGGISSIFKLPTGSIIQTVQTSYASGVSSVTSASWTNTGLSGTITPTSTSNKILVLINQDVQTFNSGAPYATGMWQLLRDSTPIWVPTTTTNGNVFSFDYGGSGLNIFRPTPIKFLDSPATTSAITYSTQIKLGTNGGISINANSGSTATMILMEVVG